MEFIELHCLETIPTGHKKERRKRKETGKKALHEIGSESIVEEDEDSNI